MDDTLVTVSDCLRRWLSRVYIHPIGILVPRTLKERRGSSWLLGSAITGDRLKTLALAFHATAGIVILACAVAIGFAPSIPGWWRPLAIIGAIISLILLVSAIVFSGAFG
ncbi:MAG TPA: hypothetical protein VGK02_03815 [Candidatus Aquicultor sp.]